LYGYKGEELEKLEDYLSGQKHVTPKTPPVFLFESLDDKRISSQNSVLFVDALHAAGKPVDAHLFAHGEHGDGLAVGVPEEDAWPDMFGKWLVKVGFVR